MEHSDPILRGSQSRRFINIGEIMLRLTHPNCEKIRIASSFDGSFRSALWTWDEARDFCTQCLPYVDILMGIAPCHLRRDGNDHTSDKADQPVHLTMRILL